MNSLLSHAILFILIILLSSGCRQEPRIEEQARLRALDSVKEVAEKDSLDEARLMSILREPLRLIDQPRLDSVGTDCFRLIAIFSWGVSPVGPVLAIRGCKEGSSYSVTIHTFEPGRDPNDPGQRRSKMEDKPVSATNFMRISNYLDSIRFDEIPSYVEVDHTSFDASNYYVERYQNRKYHCVIRSSYVDPFVYGLFAEAGRIAGISTELITQFKEREAEARNANSP